MFTDRVRIKLIAGKGGNGVVAWRREKYIPKGGPTGGNGGKGGSIIIQTDGQLNCLDSYRNQRSLHAQKGADGGPNRRQGKQGKNLILKVPRGTIAKDLTSETILFDFTQDGEEFILCKGGRGGRGNDSFKSPTNRAPNYCTMGKEGEEKTIELELKLIADIGFVGFPNAGKSTLFQALTNVRAKTAAYPFTTLRPSIGFLVTEEKQRIYLADIPGIIEDAHQNRGLGLDFLRHIERTKKLLYLLDASCIDNRDPVSDFQILQKELHSYNPTLLERPSLVILNKIDAEGADEQVIQFQNTFPEWRSRLFCLSALSGEGLQELQFAISQE